MRLGHVVLLALCLVASGAFASDVVTLTNVDDAIAKHKFLFVDFYAPWCGHCQALAPDWEKVATELKGKSDVVIAKLDCDKHGAVCQKNDVKGYPTLIWFENGAPQVYKGDRNVKDLVEFASKKAEEVSSEGPVATITTANFDRTVRSRDLALIKFYTPWCGHCKNLAPAFEKVRAELDDRWLVGEVNCDVNPALCDEYGVTGYPQVHFMRKGKQTVFTGQRTTEGIANWAKAQVEGPVDDYVTVLHEKNFDSEVKAHPEGILVEFYAPWCGHCKALAPEYEKAGATLKNKGYAGVLAKVDCTANEEVCGKYGVGGYPTIKFFKAGADPADFTGGRTAPDIVAYMTRKFVGALVHLKGAADVTKFLLDVPAAVGYFKGEDDKHYLVMKELANAREDINFGYTFDKQVASTFFTGHSAPSVRFARGESVGEDLFFTEKDYAELTGWLSRNLVPLVGELNPDTFKKYHSGRRPVVVAFVDPADSAAAIETLTPAAKAVASRAFVWCNGVQWKEVATRWFGTYESLPVVVQLDVVDDVQIPMKEGKFTSEDVLKFAKALDAGKLKWEPKSAAKPASQDDNVKVAVGSDLADWINTPGKDVLVEVYAPWCGHCQKLAPVLEEVATALKDVPGAPVIVKIDNTENDVKHTVIGNAVRGFPTILYFGANKKDTPVAFDGERNAVGIATWLKDYATVPFELPESLHSENKEGENENEHEGHDEL
jgi:protein disulfide-isomerase A1